MPFAPGARLGPYEIVENLGEGGMGEVYRARDTRLHRDVAVKVLPAAVVASTDRQARFEQEARAAAALNHPNIVAIFDVGAHDGTPYLVSELLDGETLAEKLRQGPLPVRTATDIAVQMARGLAAAHDRNIVHRDLKPANVFVTGDGRAKILDFGLAKLTQPLPALPTDSVVPTSPVGTTPGVAYGTVGYMAPEQVRGQAVDHRADIFAFGVVLYEMLTGSRAFNRETPPESLTAILREDVPELPLVTHHVPPALTRIIRRCVEKNASGRFQSALDLAFALEGSEVASGSGGMEVLAVPPRTRAPWWAVAALAGAAVGAVAMLVWRGAPMATESPLLRFHLAPPGVNGLAPFAIPSMSPDGSRVAYGSGGRIWVHALDALTPRSVGRSGGGQAVFWSPDGTQLAQNVGTTIRVMDVSGDSEQTVCDLPTLYVRGGTWNRDGVIVIGALNGGLMRCSADGGASTPLTALDGERQESGHLGPTFLPDGQRLLYWAQPSGTIRLLSLAGGAPKEILQADSVARYVEPGYLVFVRKGTLFAQPFDAGTGTLSGTPVPVVDQVLSEPSLFTAAAFDVSPTGALVYRSGSLREPSQLTWVDRHGKPLGAPLGPPALYANPNLSRDGQHLAVERLDPVARTSDILLMDLARSNVFTRFTSDPGNDTRPVWSSDGEWIAFASDRTSVENVYRRRANGTGAEELIVKSEAVVPSAWLPDGSGLVVQSVGPSSLGLLTLAPPAQVRSLDPSRAQYIDRWAELSPDGRWLAYSSQEAGTFQVYVQSFPDPDRGKWMVSTGVQNLYPRWRADGRELLYLDPEGWLIAVPVTIGATLTVGQPTRLFQPRLVFGSLYGQGLNQQYAVSSDGTRFLLNTASSQVSPSPSPMTAMLNWQKLLSR